MMTFIFDWYMPPCVQSLGIPISYCKLKFYIFMEVLTISQIYLHLLLACESFTQGVKDSSQLPCLICDIGAVVVTALFIQVLPDNRWVQKAYYRHQYMDKLWDRSTIGKTYPFIKVSKQQGSNLIMMQPCTALWICLAGYSLHQYMKLSFKFHAIQSCF